MNQPISQAARKPASQWPFHALTAAAAVVAAAAAGASNSAGVPVWAMFVGWVAFYTRGVTARDGLFNYLCSVLGVAIGMAAAAGIGLLAPVLGTAALPTVVLVVAAAVVSMRQVPGINNILCYFLGLISFFALHQKPSLTGLATLAGAMALGSTAAWLAQTVQLRIQTRHV
jgi:hypothetical protein